MALANSMTTHMQPVSVEDAITRGHRFVNYPVWVLLAAPAVLIVGFGPRLDEFFGVNLAGKLQVAFFVVCFVAAWVWWSFAVPKWRLWAYERVSDIAELKRQAVAQKLVWPDGSIFEKTEIKSKAHAMKERALEVAQAQKSVG